MSDYIMKQKTEKDGTKRIEMDVSPELKDKLFGGSKFSLPEPVKPTITTIDDNHLEEMTSIVDTVKAVMRSKLKDVPVMYAKLIIKQLWLEVKDVPDMNWGNLTSVGIPAPIPAKKGDDLE